MMISGWGKLHASYQDQHWVEKPSIFAEAAMKYFPQTGRLLELGAGHGQDSFFFAGQGYDVLSSDIEVSSLKLNHAKQPETIRKKIEVLQLDLNLDLPFEEESLDVVYAHMSLHYFDRATTDAIFRELGRVSKKGGVF
jgi:ubiquinone/menaquinone biosynthesis C-methylase UbiE